MTVEQLNAVPLWSTVLYTSIVNTKTITTEAVIVKIKNGAVRLWDHTVGWLSGYISADKITLKAAFIAGSLPAVTNFLTTPLYSIMNYKGANCYLIDKEIVQNTFYPDGSHDIENATLWVYDDEILLNAIPKSEVTFVNPPSLIFVNSGADPGPIPGKTNYILYGAIAIGIYLLMREKKT